jgi:AcrR family transcriptional regulator
MNFSFKRPIMPRTGEANQQIRNEQRSKILAAARNVFARKGRAATIADVAAEARVSQGLAYRYFASKEEIFSTLVRQAIEFGGGPAARVRQIEGTPGMRLTLLISCILEDRRVNPGFSQFLYQILVDDSTPSDVKQLVMGSSKVIQDIIRQLVVEGQASGEIANDDPDQLMVALLALFDGLMKRASLLGPSDYEKHFPDAKIILRMLKPGQLSTRSS